MHYILRGSHTISLQGRWNQTRVNEVLILALIVATHFARLYAFSVLRTRTKYPNTIYVNVSKLPVNIERNWYTITQSKLSSSSLMCSYNSCRVMVPETWLLKKRLQVHMKSLACTFITLARWKVQPSSIKLKASTKCTWMLATPGRL